MDISLRWMSLALVCSAKRMATSAWRVDRSSGGESTRISETAMSGYCWWNRLMREVSHAEPKVTVVVILSGPSACARVSVMRAKPWASWLSISCTARKNPSPCSVSTSPRAWR